ncbi:hypothetical protein VaNZ11_001269 [Volvox africanus]|uniref:SnoaL-like domain-containing protein n=1 Tax=Volvox africanus TaxID=51714 RepID=A0ABQ5RPG0_9CHLO|nr:hypothetical protein VaNZ11_001269 [Volvox africanus]
MVQPRAIFSTVVYKHEFKTACTLLNRNCARPGLRPRGTVAAASKMQRPLNLIRLFEQESSARVDTNGNGQRRPVSPGEVASVTATPNAESLAQCLFAALNNRDVSAVLSLLADDVTYENLSSSTVLRGRAAVGRFYLETLAALPEDAMFVLEGRGGPNAGSSFGGGESFAGPILQAGVAWHVELNGLVLPLSRGVGVYWVDSRTGRLGRVLDNPEHSVKQATPSLTIAAWVSPLLRDLGPVVMPAALSVTSFLENVIPGGIGGLGSTRRETGINGLSAASGSSSAGGNGPSIGPVDNVVGLAGSVVSTLSGILPFPALGPAVNGAGAPATGRGAGMNSSGVGAASGISGRMQTYQPVNRDDYGAVASGPAGSAAIKAAGGVSGAAGYPFTTPTIATSATNSGVNTSTSTAEYSAAWEPDAPEVVESSFREGVRMRPLPDPRWRATQPASPSASVASSLASIDEDDDGPFVDSGQQVRTGPVTTGGAIAATFSISAEAEAEAEAAFDGGRTFSASIGNGLGRAGNGGDGDIGGGGIGSCSIALSSMDSDSDYEVAVAIGGSTLPFTRSTSVHVNLTGLWEKDSAASQVEEYELMLDVLELGGLQEVTARLIDGLDLRHDGTRFEVSFVTVVPFFRVTERHRFGATTTMMRRDLRSGRQSTQARCIPGGVVVDMTWDAPLAGTLKEEYLASDEGSTMAVTSTLRIGPRAAMATQIYRRTDRSKKDFLASKRSAHGSLEDVLRSQEKRYGKIN